MPPLELTCLGPIFARSLFWTFRQFKIDCHWVLHSMTHGRWDQLFLSFFNSFHNQFKTISLSPTGNESRRDDSKFLGDATMSFKASLGETAVDFVFAPQVPASPAPTSSDETSPESHLYPIFILHGNGHVFCLLTGYFFSFKAIFNNGDGSGSSSWSV